MTKDSSQTKPESSSPADSLSSLSAEQRAQILGGLSDRQILALRHDWRFWARAKQLPPPGEWLVWLILAGRGFGKTRSGAEYVKEFLLTHPGSRAALVAASFADGRDAMVEGESGLLGVLSPSQLRGGDAESAWNRSSGELHLANGSRARIYSAEKPAQLRGPQHHVAWADEAAKFADAHRGATQDTTWSNLLFGLRLGAHPRCVVTTTPKPLQLIRDLIADPQTVVVRGSSHENLANLAPTFASQIVAAYEGTRLGRQELYAELLEDVPGALWNREMLERGRRSSAPELVRVVVAVDPALSASEDSDETGIIVAGLGSDGHGYTVADYSLRASPATWAQRAVEAYHAHCADRIVAEVNNGGDMVALTLRSVDAQIPYKAVHASRGKLTRAEPIAAFYERQLIHHVGEAQRFEQLEDQMCNWAPGGSARSPDRMDALVWAYSELMSEPEEQTYVLYYEDDSTRFMPPY